MNADNNHKEDHIYISPFLGFSVSKNHRECRLEITTQGSSSLKPCNYHNCTSCRGKPHPPTVSCIPTITQVARFELPLPLPTSPATVISRISACIKRVFLLPKDTEALVLQLSPLTAPLRPQRTRGGLLLGNMNRFLALRVLFRFVAAVVWFSVYMTSTQGVNDRLTGEEE